MMKTRKSLNQIAGIILLIIQIILNILLNETQAGVAKKRDLQNEIMNLNNNTLDMINDKDFALSTTNASKHQNNFYISPLSSITTTTTTTTENPKHDTIKNETFIIGEILSNDQVTTIAANKDENNQFLYDYSLSDKNIMLKNTTIFNVNTKNKTAVGLQQNLTNTQMLDGYANENKLHETITITETATVKMAFGSIESNQISSEGNHVNDDQLTINILNENKTITPIVSENDIALNTSQRLDAYILPSNSSSSHLYKIEKPIHLNTTQIDIDGIFIKTSTISTPITLPTITIQTAKDRVLSTYRIDGENISFPQQPASIHTSQEESNTSSNSLASFIIQETKNIGTYNKVSNTSHIFANNSSLLNAIDATGYIIFNTTRNSVTDNFEKTSTISTITTILPSIVNKKVIQGEGNSQNSLQSTYAARKNNTIFNAPQIVEQNIDGNTTLQPSTDELTSSPIIFTNSIIKSNELNASNATQIINTKSILDSNAIQISTETTTNSYIRLFTPTTSDAVNETLNMTERFDNASLSTTSPSISSNKSFVILTPIRESKAKQMMSADKLNNNIEETTFSNEQEITYVYAGTKNISTSHNNNNQMSNTFYMEKRLPDHGKNDTEMFQITLKNTNNLNNNTINDDVKNIQKNLTKKIDLQTARENHENFLEQKTETNLLNINKISTILVKNNNITPTASTELVIKNEESSELISSNNIRDNHHMNLNETTITITPSTVISHKQNNTFLKINESQEKDNKSINDDSLKNADKNFSIVETTLERILFETTTISTLDEVIQKTSENIENNVEFSNTKTADHYTPTTTETIVLSVPKENTNIIETINTTTVANDLPSLSTTSTTTTTTTTTNASFMNATASDDLVLKNVITDLNESLTTPYLIENHTIINEHITTAETTELHTIKINKISMQSSTVPITQSPLITLLEATTRNTGLIEFELPTISSSIDEATTETTSENEVLATTPNTPAIPFPAESNTSIVTSVTTAMLPVSIHYTTSTESIKLFQMDKTNLMDNLENLNADTSKSETDVNVIIAISVSTVGIIALVLLVGFLYLMRKRQKQMSYGQRCRPVSLDAYSLDNVSVMGSVRRKTSNLNASKRTYGNIAFDDPALKHNILNAMELSKFVERRSIIFEEFREVPQIITRANEVPPGCEDKNRYANVIPLPETRVALQQQDSEEITEYINANYVQGPGNSPQYYIACQAPIQSTVIDFWRMIWEQNSRVIIQATDLIENSIEKCAEYLPPSVTLDNHTIFGDFQVTLKNREVKDYYAISTLKLTNAKEDVSRELMHYWYKWPETGVPTEEPPIIAMLLEVRSTMKAYAIEQAAEQKDNNIKSNKREDKEEINGNISMEKLGTSSKRQSPLTVHCSPGTGRTGTIIAIDMAIRSLESGERLVDIPQIVYYIRRGRAGAVQTKEQYEFIYKVAYMYATKLTNISQYYSG